MACIASASISVLNLCRSLSAMALCAAGRANLIDQPFQVRELLPSAIAEYGRNEPRPAPHIHVDDRIGVAEHVFQLGKPRIENAGMALRFKGIAIGGVRNLLRRINTEMHRLTKIGANS